MCSRVVEQKHKTPFRACLDESMVGKGSEGGMTEGRCSSKHVKKKERKRESEEEGERARWCPWVTDMELIADCRL